MPGGHIAGSGGNVNYTNYNGYVLYFSDHRGMLPSTHPSNGGQTSAGVINGESGIEDVVNSSQDLTSTTTDGVPEALSYYGYSPEDVDQNGFLDNWGEKNIGYGFGINTNTAPLNPYKRINVTGAGTAASVDCASYNGTLPLLCRSRRHALTGDTDQEGLANPVSGARHVLKLVDAGMSAGLVSYVPVMPPASGCTQSAANPTGCGGFTIASENPVYVQGNYNSNAADPFWGTANERNSYSDTPFGGFHHRRHGHGAVELVERYEQPDVPNRPRQSLRRARLRTIAWQSRAGRTFRSPAQPGPTAQGSMTSAPTADCTTSSAISRAGAAP